MVVVCRGRWRRRPWRRSQPRGELLVALGLEQLGIPTVDEQLGIARRGVVELGCQRARSHRFLFLLIDRLFVKTGTR